MWGKKFLTPEVWEKIITSKLPIPSSPTNVQWSCQPFRRSGKKRIRHVRARVHQVVVFKTKVSHFKIENTPIKDKNGKFNGMLNQVSEDSAET